MYIAYALINHIGLHMDGECSIGSFKGGLMFDILIAFVEDNLQQFVVNISVVLILAFSVRLGWWLLFLLGWGTPHGFYIGGKWNTVYVDDFNGKCTSHEETATMHQFGTRVHGTVKNKVTRPTRKYRVRGRIRGDVLVATYEQKGWRAGIDRGAFTLLLDRDNDRLDGQYCWTDNTKKEGGKAVQKPVASGSYIWYQKGSSRRLRTLLKGLWARVTRRGVHARRDSISGKGVFAAGPIEIDEPIEHFKGYVIPSASPNSLFLEDSHIEPTGVLKWLNHSCVPNAAFMNRELKATETIEAGQEVTIDYDATDRGLLLKQIVCHCGSDHCRGTIGPES
jgi:hypothetical protein